MKLNTYSFAAGAVALSATALAMPTLYKRITNGNFFGCMATVMTSGSWSTTCASEAVHDFGLIKSVRVDDLKLAFSDSTAAIGLSSSKLTADLIQIPEGFGFTSFPVTDSSQKVIIVYAGIEIAEFTTPTSATTVVGNTVSTVVGNSQLNILSGQEANFVAFMSDLISKVSLAFIIRGNLGVTIKTPLPYKPSVSIPSIAYSAPITLQGCANFVNVEFLKQISLTKDAAGQYTLTSSINIRNPSQLVLEMGTVELNLFGEKGLIGVTTFTRLELAMGDNIVTAVTVFTDESVLAGGTFTLQGFDGSSKSGILAKALAEVKVKINIPKLSDTSA
ncbi:hypothetical protein BGX21_011165 [Mortierella sp. AD011]|nr:hypothetical protein BGX20_003449 [Mortierella sp. AD010]KAF9402130.1 hypothetical protein BGX21_011165 [Mortierella sp. AD011]